MDGSERMTIVKTKIAYPFGVTLDYANKHVYWVDGYHSNVQRVNYDGSNRRTITTLGSVSKICIFFVILLQFRVVLLEKTDRENHFESLELLRLITFQ